MNIYAAVPGHVSNIKKIYMPCDQGMYQTSKGNTCPPFGAWCCIAFTVTTGTFDPPTHRDISNYKMNFICNVIYVFARNLDWTKGVTWQSKW